MAVTKIKEVTLKKKTYSFNDLKSVMSFAVDCKLKKGEITPVFGGVGTGKGYTGAIKNFYYIGGNYYLIKSNGKLHILDGQTTGSISDYTFSANTKAVSVLIGGNKKTLFIDENRAIVADTGNAIDLPYGKYVMLFMDSLFIADNNKIYFSKPLNHTDFSVGIDNGGYFDIDSSLGNICAMTNDGDNLLVLCTHGVVKISVKGERIDYTVKKLNLPFFSVSDNTAKEVGDALCFIENENLKVVKDGKMKSYSLPLEKLNYMVNSTASFNDYYCLNVSIYGYLDDFSLLVNVNTGDYFIITKTIYDGGYYVDNTSHEFMLLSEDAISGSWVCVGDETNLGEQGIKKITDVCIESSGSATLGISGKHEIKNFSLTNGFNEIKTNLTADLFTFSLSGSAEVSVKNLKIKYVLLGE